MTKEVFYDLKSPLPLRRGDTIGIVAPSSGLAGLFPHRVEQGVRALEQEGFKVRFADHARERAEWVSASPQERADDLHKMFVSDDVRAIMCTIGGNHANQVLKYVDFDLIRKHPKIFIGYSDITVLHYALARKAGLRTFYGPCLVSEFGEYPETLSFTKASFEKALMSTDPMGAITTPDEWTDEFLDWFVKADTERPRTMHKHYGYEWWREGIARGPLWGGAIPSINHLAGTEYWVDPAGCTFFLDIPEGGPGISKPQDALDSFLADLDNLGVFKKIAGLIIGRPYRYDTEKDARLKEMILYYVHDYSYPIVYNAPIGHTAPIVTIPFGLDAALDSSRDTFTFAQSGVAL